MDYKKKYEEALERAKVVNPGTTDYEVAVKIFPELGESEDEKIRKWLIEMVKEVRKANPTNVDHNGNCSDAIAWLEKQGKQTSIDEIKPKFKIGDTIRCKGSMTEYTIESIYGGCYHGKGWGLFIDGDEDYELVEQKTTWSEKDEKMLKSIISSIRISRSSCEEDDDVRDLFDNEIEWLKSIKERMKGE